MTRCSIEPRTIKYVNGYGFLTFARKYKKQLMDTGLDASKKVVHKAAKINGKTLRSSRSQMFLKIAVLKNFAITIKKTPFLLKGDSNTGVFLRNF